MTDKSGYIIIPAYNEEKHIGYVVSQATKILPTFVIDDGSNDNTSIIAEKNGAQVFLQVPNQGKGEALKRGFQEAINLNCQYVITIDADGQHDVLETTKFISLFNLEKIDLIIGYRDFSKMPFSRRIANTVGGWAFSWAMGMKILDNQSGYRLLSRRLLEKVLESKESGFEFEVDVIATCIKSNYSVGWVPIRTIYGNEISHIHPLHHIKNFFKVVWQTHKSMKGSYKK
jgi:glycosyltransferase involved in cell wall biosynthesis